MRCRLGGSAPTRVCSGARLGTCSLPVAGTAKDISTKEEGSGLLERYDELAD